MEPIFETRRVRTAATWGIHDELVLIHAGGQLGRPGMQDQCYPYRAHPHFRWLTGLSVRDAVLAFDPSEGWTEFFPTITPMDTVWEGLLPLNRGRALSELPAWLEKRQDKTITHLGAGHDQTTSLLEQRLLEARRPKDEAELLLMYKAVTATAAGFAAARDILRDGLTERELQIEIETAFARNGATGVAYDTIVGFGPTSAIFHAEPGSRALKLGEQVLIDAGAEVEGYCADVTRTLPGPGGFTSQQAEIYALLDRVERACCDACRPGVEWHEIHRMAARGIAAGLRELGILRATPEEALETEAIALFFPHGVGHLVGLGVRDASGVGPGRGEKRRCCGVTPRCDLALEPGFLVTVEPGIYFIPTLLNDPVNRERFAAQVDWPTLDKWLVPGGFRIEDDILVSDSEPINLTAEIPR
ncbi:MAG: aminopeptidase P N-terminal domain-containing protein [Armatimonadetes bacterium]|nr:aminopeptidase P N-terminal domain-containing protein [Armatimonadota bacterium]